LESEITIETIKEWHSSLMYRTRLYDLGLAGVFKKYPNKILGADFDTASPLETEDKIKSLISDYNSLKNITLEDLARFHVEFEKIYPFQDGNGRIGRFIFLKQLLDNRFPLQYMNGDTSDEYKKALANCKDDDVISYIKMQRDFIYDNRNMF
jgi:cell filamentation protein, protein adenylyltransferase